MARRRARRARAPARCRSRRWSCRRPRPAPRRAVAPPRALAPRSRATRTPGRGDAAPRVGVPSERLPDRQVHPEPVVVRHLPEPVPHIEADRADRRGDPEPATDSREELREREVVHPRRDGADVEERDAAQEAPDRKAPFEVQEYSEIAAEGVVRGIERPDPILLVAPNGRAPARLEAVLDDEDAGGAERRRTTEARRDSQDRR